MLFWKNSKDESNHLQKEWKKKQQHTRTEYGTDEKKKE